MDAATGSLGQGLSVGAGLALGAKRAGSSARIYVLMGDGEMAEGNVWEAAAFTAHAGITNFVAIGDVNALGQSQRTMYQHDMEVYRLKFEAQGWRTEVIDGHDAAAVMAALDRAKENTGRPTAIMARTIKGQGVSFLADKDGWHGKPLSPEQLEKALAEMGSPIPQVIPDDGKSYARTSLPVPPDFPAPAAPEYKDGEQIATREAYGIALRKLASRESSSGGSGWRREKFNIFRDTRESIFRPAHRRLHRRAKYGGAIGRSGGAGSGAVRGDVCVLSFARVRPSAHGRRQPEFD